MTIRESIVARFIDHAVNEGMDPEGMSYEEIGLFALDAFDGLFTLERGSSVFMDGTVDYHLRRLGKPGIIATLRLLPSVAEPVETETS